MMSKLIQESGESYSCSTVLYINTIWGHVSMELNCVQTMRKSKVYVHGTTIRSQNAEQLRENGWLPCSRKPQPFKTYDSSEFGVWSSYTVREAYKPLNLRKTTLRKHSESHVIS